MDTQALNVEEDHSIRKKKTAITFALLFVGAIVGAVTLVYHSSSSSPDDSMKSIKLICQPTHYRQQCQDALSQSAAANSTSDPEKLLQAAFQVASDRFRSAGHRSKLLCRAVVDPVTVSALSACTSLMRQATCQLESSIDQLGDLVNITGIDSIAGGLKIRLRTAITHQTTCMDRLQNTTGNATDEMRDILYACYQLSSNALAILDNIFMVLQSFDLSVSNGEEKGFPAAVGPPKQT